MGAIAGFNFNNKSLLERINRSLEHRITNTVFMDVQGFSGLQGNGKEILRNQDFIILFEGTIYNSDELKSANSLLHSETPELILELFLKNGPEAFDMLEGMFVFAIFNTLTEELILVRDQLGERALYFWHKNNKLVFASEIKAVLQHHEIKREVNLNSLQKYLTFSYVPGSETMLRDVYELLPGHYLHFKDNKLTIKQYWDVIPDDYFALRPEISEAQVIELLKTELESSVKKRLPGEHTPLGAFLSGGIDSSLVCAIAAKYREKPLNTYSIHFGKNYPNELYYSSMVAKHLRSNHRIIEVKPKNFLEELFHIIWCLDDPIGDPITVPNFILAEKARKEVPVILNGEGGDPCFGGPKNIPMMLSQIYNTETNFSVEKYYLKSYKKCYEILPFLFSQKTQDILKKDFPGLEEFVSGYLTQYELKNLLDKLMFLNIKMKGTHHILVKVDKMTSANKLTARAPLFSPGIVRNSFMIPPGLKLKGRVEKYALKKAVEALLPHEVVYREKKGMMVPVKYWFQKDLKSYARKMLSPKRVKEIGIFNPAYIKDLLEQNLEYEHRSNTGLKLWMLLTFDIWHRIFIENTQSN